MKRIIIVVNRLLKIVAAARYRVTQEFCYAKIHRCVVTEANLSYPGSVTIDKALLRAAGVAAYSKVDVVNVTQSLAQRVTTYAIEGEEGSGVFCLNGAAAHHFRPGDIAIVMAYECVPVELIARRRHLVVHVNAKRDEPGGYPNRIDTVTSSASH